MGSKCSMYTKINSYSGSIAYAFTMHYKTVQEKSALPRNRAHLSRSDCRLYRLRHDSIRMILFFSVCLTVPVTTTSCRNSDTSLVILWQVSIRYSCSSLVAIASEMIFPSWSHAAGMRIPFMQAIGQNSYS